MLDIPQPEDILGLAIKNMLDYRKYDEKFSNYVMKWSKKKPKKIVVNVLPMYAVTIIFNGNKVIIERGETKKALKVTLHIHSMLEMSNGRLGVIKATLTRKLKIKGIHRIGTILKFMKIFLKTMKMVAAESNVNYYEVHKHTR